MNLLDRFVASVRRQGVRRTLIRTRYHAADALGRSVDRWGDFVRGTDTVGCVEVRHLNVTSGHRKHGFQYEPTPTRPFRKLMKALRLPPGEVLVDIGSGKGRVLILAADLGFAKVVGVEHAPALCEAARRNMSIVRRRKHLTASAVVHCCDAAEYRFSENETVIYLANPFDHVVLAKVLDNLSDSLARSPRKAWLIYLCASYFVGPTSLRETIVSRGVFSPAGEYRYNIWDYSVFIHVPH